MTSRSEAEYRALAQRAMAAFRSLPNVHAVGIGGRERAGKPTGEIVLKVLVDKKTDELDPSERVPATFEGVPTDVVEAPRPRLALPPVPGATLGGPYTKDEGRYRPLRGGIQVMGSQFSGAGTLGIICRVDEAAPRRIVALTCHHVLFSSASTEVAELTVGQPTPDDSVTKCCRGIFGTFLKGYRDSTMDAAAVRFELGTEYYAQQEDIGVVTGDHAITTAEAATLTYNVRKRGRTTRLTGGMVQALHLTDTSGDTGFMGIRGNPPTGSGTGTFADHGDSGSGVLNDAGEVVALLYAAGLTPGAADAGWGYAWPFEDVKARFAADGLDLIVEVSAAPDTKVVTQVGAAAPLVEGEAPAVARKVKRNLSDSGIGRALTTFWMRHSVELNRLVNKNRRVMTRWHRTGGPALFQVGVRSVYDPQRPLPSDIAGRSTDECLNAVLDLFDQYGSASLRDDIRAYRGLLPAVGGRSYAELLAALRGELRAQWHD